MAIRAFFLSRIGSSVADNAVVSERRRIESLKNWVTGHDRGRIIVMAMGE